MDSSTSVPWADLLANTPPRAHGFPGTGWLDPLTGIDHMLAMVAVGATLILDHPKGRGWLRSAGALAAAIGMYLLIPH